MNLGSLNPFRVYRPERPIGTIDVSLKCLEDWACGWEWGWRDEIRWAGKPVIELRVGKLLVLYLEFYAGGYEVWFLGFWAFPSWWRVS